MTANELIESIQEEVIAWRRYLHQHPELSFHEENTSQFIYDILRSFGNLELSRPTKTSVMARLIGAEPGKVLALRADMDALPLQEDTTFDFISQNPGVMHACGHDIHMAILLGTAKVLSSLQDAIKGEVRFLFQHAEELFPGGASEMVAAGVMDGVDFILGAHVWNPLWFGKIGIGYGPLMASPDTFHITVIGKGGHAAMPHEAIDSIAIGAQIVTNLQHIVSRNIDPLEKVVISMGKFIAGTTDNVIPGSAEIVGTIRTFDLDLRTRVPELMERVVKGITEAHGATYEFNLKKGYLPVINNEALTHVLEETASELFGEEAIEKVHPTMGAEDFSAYQTKAPGAFFFIGGGNPDEEMGYPHHHPRFSVDERSIALGMKMFVHAAFKLMPE